MIRIFDKKLKKIHMVFLSYCPFSKFWTLKFCNYDIPQWDIVLKLHVWIPHGKIADAYFFFLELSPLVKLRPFEKIEMKFCKCHISKSIKDRNLKLVSAERG